MQTIQVLAGRSASQGPIVRSRSGMLVWSTLLSCLVVSILAGSFLSRSGGSFRRSAHILHDRMAADLASGAIELTLAQLRDQLRNPSSTLAARLVETTSPQSLEGDIDTDQDLPDLEAALDRFAKRFFNGKGVSVKVQISIERCELLVAESETTLGRDAREKTGDMLLVADAWIGEVHQEISVVRPFRIVNLVPPVTSKFTLFVKQPETNTVNSNDSTDRGRGGFNRFRNTIQGAPVSSSDNVRPLSVFNHPLDQKLRSSSFSHEENGWIFLGGQQDVVLNLTSGSDDQFGEAFHYRSLEELGRGATAQRLEYTMDDSSSDTPEFFLSKFTHVSWETGKQTTVDFKLKKRRLGFFEVDDGTPQGDMDSGLLDIDASTYTVASSCLHLFGNQLDPSPTRVIGRVFRAYPEYSGIIADLDGDGEGDATLWPLLGREDAEDGELSASFALRGSSGDEGIFLLEDLQNLDGSDAGFSNPVSRGYDESRIFSGSHSYGRVRSQIVVEPYARSVDSLVAPATCIDPDVYPGIEGSEDPDSEVTLEFQEGSDSPYFTGRLGQFDGSAMDLRLVFGFSSLEEFRSWSGQSADSTGSLELGCPIRIGSSELDLSAIRRVVGGGTLQAQSIKVSSLESDSPAPVGLVARNGDIVSSFEGRIEASLVALEGTLVSSESGGEVDISGNLVLGRLLPDEIRDGGRISYDTNLDPLAGQGNGYESSFRVFIADTSIVWRSRS